MISFDVVIRGFGPEALRLQLKESEKGDSNALLALENKDAPSRNETIHSWLRSYKVFQGFDDARGLAIATAVVDWADKRDLQRGLTTVDSLGAAHAELEAVCVRANSEKRAFTSLASKALWLCYPRSVPIFDDLARCALSVISKFETDIVPLAENDLEYRRFVQVWKMLYDRYAVTLNEIDIGDYPYRVRIFDKILWLIGEPRYGRRPALLR